MAAAKTRVTVRGSEKAPLRGAKVIGSIDPKERIEIAVIVRPRATSAATTAASTPATEATPPEQRIHLSREEFAAQRGADPGDVAKVEAFAQMYNLTVVEVNLAQRSIRLTGTVKDLSAAFQPKLKRARLGSRVLRVRTGGLSIPKDLAPIVVAVLGFDNRPAAQPHHRILSGARRARAAGKASSKAPHNAADGSFTPPQVAKLYDFPAGLTGSGQCIAIVELNDFDQNHKPTGTGFSASDLKAYFKSLKLTPPTVTAVGVASDGSSGANVPGPDPNSDGEVMLDIEVAGAVAPKAKIAVYFALNTDNGFLAAVNAALHDTVRKPSVISISWGSSEDLNTGQALTAFNQVLQDASMLGVTVCCSAGDDGSSDASDPSARDGKPHVDFPASSPFALACGGTKLLGSGTTIRSEVVWNEGGGATGGGVSNVFARPTYQAKSKVPKSPKGKTGRGVPDIAADAAPSTGYKIRLVGGKSEVIGGTSAVAPLWAGLMALFNQRLAAAGKAGAGFINPHIYSVTTASGAFHDIVSGNNDVEGLGKYKAATGWDPCTGLGTPNGAKLLTALGG